MNRAPAAIAFYVGAEIVADEVVAAIILLDFRERVAEISEVEEGFPAGVSRKSGERVAGIFALIGLVIDGRAGKHGISVGGIRGGVAAGRRREQTARIKRINRDVRAIRGVSGGAQLRAIFFAGLSDASGEFDERFSAGNSAEDVGEAFNCGEFLVGIEDVEFGFVGREGGAGVFLDVVFTIFRGGVERIGKIGGAVFSYLRDGFFEQSRDRW